MFASSSLAILISAATAMASTHQAARNHHEIAKRLDNTTSPLDKRAQFTNQEFTWYPTDTGPDACTGKNHQDSDFYVAMGYNQFGDGSACCGKQMSITVNGKTATATCVDECASCPAYGQLDFTKGLFQYFTGGDLDVGVIHGSWSFTDGSGGSGGGDDGDDGDDTPTTTKKTTTKHTTTSTSTHHTTTSTHVEAAVTTTHHTTTSTPKPSSSKKASSSAKPSSSAESSSKVSSSSAKPSSSSSVIEPSSPALPSATPSATPNQGVANAGSGAGTSAGDSDTGPNGISGAIGTGSGDDTSDAASLSFNKLCATVAVVALVASQAL
ncbi:hypothetical protein DFH08DRAFT_802615 [Mycena albidolilacea]|uniref:Uncharacterized protein n=1 Tax=Mycena albidolilacea TaxID=1033008 RepID=A0AAD7AEE7_9AGAR|nr:hypothetical protein DFH08DRAFT_802615 [Mycena albidolilacea]